MYQSTLSDPVRRPRRRLAAALAALTLAATVSACSDDDADLAATDGDPVGAEVEAPVDDEQESATSLDVVAGEYSFSLSSTTVAAGRLPLELRNEGAQPHQLMVARLHDGVTLDDYVAASHDSEGAASALVDEAGGINAVDAGATRTGYADLEAGRYVVLCFLPTPGGPSHLHEGMVAELTVVDPPVAEVPAPVQEIALGDFAFTLPGAGLDAPGAYRVVNAGAQDHEMSIMRIDEGKTVPDAIAFLVGGFVGEQPFEFVGGAGGVEPGADTYIDLDLAPGEYLAMCFIPDPATGKRHAELGMVSTFTIP